jgi:hypothetical protein
MILRQLTLLAETTHQSIEALVPQNVLTNLLPATDTAPPKLQVIFCGCRR